MKKKSLVSIIALLIVSSILCVMFAGCSDSVTLSSIAVTSQPTTVSYTEGDTFDASGMVVTATYSDGSTEVITGYTVDTTTALTTSDTSVTITYSGISISVSITVAEKVVTPSPDDEPDEVTLSSIAVTSQPTKVSYTEGDTFDASGMVITATYSDNSTAVITGYTVDTTTALTTSDTSVAVTFGGISISVSITVAEKVVTPSPDDEPDEVTLSSIAVTSQPTKVSYTEGDTFDASGMVITATYSDSSTEVITNYTVDKTSALTASDTIVTVTYEGKTATVAISVAEKQTTFTITFVIDGKGTTYLHELGDTPEYTGATPTKDPDDLYNYTFSHWSPTITSVTEDVNYYAQFTTSARTYSVVWQTEEGTTLETDTDLAYGASLSFGSVVPTKDNYEFANWVDQYGNIVDITTSTVTYDMILSPSYVGVAQTVTFMNDNVVYSTSQVAYGESAVAPSDPTKTTDDQYTYTFASWNTSADGTGETVVFDETTITSATTYYAVYSTALRSYNISFATDGSGIGSIDRYVISSVAYGSTITVEGNTVTIGDTTITATVTATDNDEFTFTFDGWSVSNGDTISTATTITANFKATTNTYEVTVNVSGVSDTYAKTVEYDYGTIATITATEVDGYICVSYTYNDVVYYGTTYTMTITGNDSITANYVESAKTHKITVDGEESYSIENATITLTVPTAQTGYEFTGWNVVSGNVTVSSDNTFTMPSSDVEIESVFALIDYTVSVNTLTNATITSNVATANYDETVTITVVMDDNSFFGSIKANGLDSLVITDNNDGTYSFAMPDGNVSITVVVNTVSSIAVSGYTTYFEQDASFDNKVTVTANFTNGGSAVLSSGDYTISGFNSATVASAITLTVSYTVDDTFTTTYSVEITEPLPKLEAPTGVDLSNLGSGAFAYNSGSSKYVEYLRFTDSNGDYIDIFDTGASAVRYYMFSSSTATSIDESIGYFEISSSYGITTYTNTTMSLKGSVSAGYYYLDNASHTATIAMVQESLYAGTTSYSGTVYFAIQLISTSSSYANSLLSSMNTTTISI